MYLRRNSRKLDSRTSEKAIHIHIYTYTETETLNIGYMGIILLYIPQNNGSWKKLITQIIYSGLTCKCQDKSSHIVSSKFYAILRASREPSLPFMKRNRESTKGYSMWKVD